MEKTPFRAGKLYEYSGDLREYGFNLRLNMYCQMDKAGNHKLELIDVGRMRKSDILREVTQVFDVDPLALCVMRVDLAVDVPGVPLQWFRETVLVQHKRYRAAVTGQPFYSEMGSKDIETLYFGKRPNLIRIYDKTAEYDAQYRRTLRKLSKGAEPLSFESVMGFSKPISSVTRVERQFGGRIPASLETFRNLCSNDFEYKPFANLKITEHVTYPDRDSNVSFETYCTGMYLRSIALNDGKQALKNFISRESNGNAAWAWRKYRSFLPSSSEDGGLSNASLQSMFADSLRRQMSA